MEQGKELVLVSCTEYKCVVSCDLEYFPPHPATSLQFSRLTATPDLTHIKNIFQLWCNVVTCTHYIAWKTIQSTTVATDSDWIITQADYCLNSCVYVMTWHVILTTTVTTCCVELCLFCGVLQKIVYHNHTFIRPSNAAGSFGMLVFHLGRHHLPVGPFSDGMMEDQTDGGQNWCWLDTFN